uniref:Uncharacterized protein n=1 Tax=Schistosoma curassoni TaxID=6186 RepID=A0A183JM11_9TREM
MVSIETYHSSWIFNITVGYSTYSWIRVNGIRKFKSSVL